QLKSLASMLIKRFAQGSTLQSAIASASAILQSADEMKMAELNDPTLACAQSDNSGNLVGDRGSDAFVYRGRNRWGRVRPPLHVLSAWPQHRIEENGSILMAWLDCHHIQNPIFSSKPEIKSIQDQSHGTFWQAQNPSLRHKPPHNLTPTVSHCLLRQTS